MRQRVKRNFWDRIWMWNQNFDVLGPAPMAAKQGDVLFVPYGCTFVMVLREECDGTFSVVGPCWLYNFMHGEAIKRHGEGIIEEREVVFV